MFQIIVKSNSYTYMYDSQERQHLSASEAVEAALRLLCNSFKPESVEEAANDFAYK